MKSIDYGKMFASNASKWWRPPLALNEKSQKSELNLKNQI